MSTNVRSTVVGVFRDQRLADQARAQLRDAGFTDDQIHASGAGSVGGFLKSLFTGQAATSDSLRKELADMAIPDEEAQYYTDEYKNGNSVIIVEAPGREQEARNILQRNGAYDYHMTHQPVGSTPSMQQARANMPAGTADVNRNVPPPNMPAGTADVNRNVPPPNMPAGTADVNRNVPPPNMPAGTANANRNVPPPNMPPQPLQRPTTPPPTAGQRLDQEQQKVADGTTLPFTNSTSTSTPRRTDSTPVAQQTTDTDTNAPEVQLQALQAQYQRIQQQLHDAQAQLQAAKQRESELHANRQRESQMHTLRKQMQEAQMQLQSTMAELQATEARIAAQYNQSQQ